MTAPDAAAAATPPRLRRLQACQPGQAVTDGAGVRIERVIDHTLERRLDPFLMLDAFRSDDPRDYIAGFPDHPHRGFETVTYMLAGRLRHRDNHGHQGLLEAGGVQWMCAGRGIVHSEMPEQEDGLMEGFQLWLNLPARRKMDAPWYRDIPAAALPRATLPGGVTAVVIAGHCGGVDGAHQSADTEVLYLDITLPAGARFAHPLPPAHNACVFAHRGHVSVAGQALPPRQLGLLETDPAAGAVLLEASEAARVLLLAGKPLGEPIARYGPFVMNTHTQIRQAIGDFQAGRFGPG